MKKNILIALFIIFKIFDVQAQTSGNCGAYNETSNSYADNCQWTLSTDGTLTITGTGKMYETPDEWRKAPWFDQMQSIKNVQISNGITSIGEGAFYAAYALQQIEIPQSVTSIGSGAFAYSTIQSIDIPQSVTSIGEGAFEYTRLTSLNLPEGLTQIAPLTLRGLHLENLTIPDAVTSIGWWTFKDGVVDEVYCSHAQQQMCKDALIESDQDINALKLYSRNEENGQYLLDGKRYKSFNDMQKQENGIEAKRIYTVEEAGKISKETGNKFMLRYK